MRKRKSCTKCKKMHTKSRYIGTDCLCFRCWNSSVNITIIPPVIKFNPEVKWMSLNLSMGLSYDQSDILRKISNDLSCTKVEFIRRVVWTYLDDEVKKEKEKDGK